VCEYEEFLELDVHDLEKLLSRDDLFVEDEEDLCNSIVKWVVHDLQNRKKHFVKLLEYVNQSIIDPDFIKKKIEPLCGEDSEVFFLEYFKRPTIPCDRTFTQQPRNYNRYETMVEFSTRDGVSEYEIKGFFKIVI